MTWIEPAKNPCGSCPYRKDVPSGVWHETEYEKLPPFDGEDASTQPLTVFGCHQQNGRLCGGWVACHDMPNQIGLRIACAQDFISPESMEKILDYTTDVPVFESGQAAYEHGIMEVQDPSPKAQKIIDRLRKKLGYKHDQEK